MEPKPNWLVRHINLITTAVALYPWLLMILLLWDNQRHHQPVSYTHLTLPTN